MISLPHSSQTPLSALIIPLPKVSLGFTFLRFSNSIPKRNAAFFIVVPLTLYCLPISS